MSAIVLLRAVFDAELVWGSRGSSLRLDEPSESAIALGLGFRAACGEPLCGFASGPPDWDAALRDAVAVGLDSVTRIWSPVLEEGDLVTHARALAGQVPREARLVIAGGAASDHGSGILPLAIAELLGWPAIEDAIDVGMEGGRLAVRVRARGGRLLTYGLPARAVLVAGRGHALPYPTVARKLAAQRAVPAVCSPAAGPGMEQRLYVESYGPARPVTRHLFRPSTSANAGGRLRQLMAGGASPSPSAAKALQSGDGLAAQVADLLAREGLLD